MGLISKESYFRDSGCLKNQGTEKENTTKHSPTLQQARSTLRGDGGGKETSYSWTLTRLRAAIAHWTAWWAHAKPGDAWQPCLVVSPMPELRHRLHKRFPRETGLGVTLSAGARWPHLGGSLTREEEELQAGAKEKVWVRTWGIPKTGDQDLDSLPKREGPHCFGHFNQLGQSLGHQTYCQGDSCSC